jgi:multiple sugar transport system permease protein
LTTENIVGRTLRPTTGYRKGALRSFREHRTAYLFLLPAILILLAFVALPIVDGVAMSFQRVALSGERTFAGLQNYRLLFGQPRFLNNLVHSLVYLAGNLMLSVPLGYLAAVVVTSGRAGSRFFRTLFLLPWVMASVVTALVFRSLVDPVSGPLTLLFAGLTGDQHYFLVDPQLAMLTLIIHAAWRSFPLVMLFLAAGITAIPRQVYEAASLDGAKGWVLFRHITLPLTRTPLFIILLVITAFTLQDAEGAFALTGGGPGESTEVLAVRLLREAFRNLNLGIGSTLSLVLLALGFAVMVAQLIVLRGEQRR